jgi:alternate signal-mediated exported protein
MNKTTRGALAGGAAALLLLGGAGTLAFWNATDTNDPGAIGSGRLALLAETGVWKLNGGVVEDPTAVLLVPGDEVTFDGTYVIDAGGDNLQATVSVTGAAEAGTLAGHVSTTSEFTLAGTALAGSEVITELDDGDMLGVAIDVDFPFGTTVDNTSQGKTLDLSQIAVVLTQTDATP